MLTRRHLLSSLVPAFGILTAPAQEDETPEKRSPLFPRLFPEPTGKNGFEEILRAGERIRDAESNGTNRAPYPSPRQNTNTLSVKRTYLADPASRAALSLLRQGVRKPMEIAPIVASPAYYEMSLPMLRLSRLLGFRVHVGFADGDGAAVVGEVLGFLRFADGFKPVSVVSGSIGGSLERNVLTPLIRVRDAWSERDCARLLAFAETRANAPDPAFAALTAERESARSAWERSMAKPEELAGLFEYLATIEDTGDEETERITKAEMFEERLRADSGVRARVWGEMADAITVHYDRAAALLADPTKRIFLDTPAEEKSRFHEITLLLRSSVVTDAQFAVRQAVENRVNNQLLATHAAIRRYRWENDRLPKTLDELKLGAKLVTDPFTAKPLLYEPDLTGGNYKLASAGALLPGTDGKPDARERFTLPREYPAPPKSPAQ